MVETASIADLLDRVREVARDGIIDSALLSRKDRESLQKAGWLKRIIRGWYLLLQPTDSVGETTAWYASFWTFASLYLERRLGEDYCLSAESSLDLHVGPTQIPQQVIVIAGRGGSTVVDLLEKTSLLSYQQANNLPDHEHTQIVRGVRAMILPMSLVRVSPAFFARQPEAAEIALRMLGEPAALIRILVSGGHVTASERLAGAFQFLGEHEHAERIRTAMEAAGHRFRPQNPFVVNRPVFGAGKRIRSPYAARVKAHWASMREPVQTAFTLSARPLEAAAKVLERVEATHVEDAYHSLSIEGYRVTTDLIRRIREGKWNPESDAGRPERNALAAKGYNEAFESVSECIRAVLDGESAPKVVCDSIQRWYAALFSASVTAGIVSASDLAGYRDGPVYIRGARHVPPPREAVLDAMEAFEECMTEEESPVVRAILGHFIFTWIHPFPDGNGRVARFIMNAMLVTGGYPWTVIRVDHRASYMAGLEQASSKGDIIPFAKHVEAEARTSLKIWTS